MTEKDKKLEDFTDKLMANAILEKPSVNFTDNIIASIEASTETKAIKLVYKPLISKSLWVVIATIICGVFGYIYFKEPVLNSSFLDKIDISNLVKNPFVNIDFTFSKTFVYAIVLLALMLCIQILALKNYFNKRLQF